MRGVQLRIDEREGAVEHGRVADDHEVRERAHVGSGECLGDDLWADAGRIAEGDGDEGVAAAPRRRWGCHALS